MGRRSRKRGLGPAAERPPQSPVDPGVADEPLEPEAPAPDAATPRPRPAERAPASRPPSRRARLDDAPQAPWHPVPLTELCILVGLVLLAVALLGGGGSKGLLLAFGLTLVTLATAELALREHLAGHRSHSALLAGLAAMVVAVPLAVFVRPAKAVVLGAAVVVFLIAFQVLREIFRRRSGGLGWRS